MLGNRLLKCLRGLLSPRWPRIDDFGADLAGRPAPPNALKFRHSDFERARLLTGNG